MPFYDMRCNDHGYFDGIFCKMDDRHEQGCPECGEFLKIVQRPVAVHGYTAANPLSIPQIGESFESNAQMRDYFRANPDAKILSESERRTQVDQLRNRVEQTAVREGFKSRHHKSEVAKQHAREGRNVFGQKVEPKAKPSTPS